ncbi:uncharacterized protein B0H18DRAFT_242039 [Fomitopsis serialis]|uniref:uncharacterized protein n=1 Tax=Fomitopsis serialis TaxID=139415 RepID=UPI0020081A73|nr:uncharacterized protein B0H18DRAFT_242039 [Neoantrodia serialis]KAH9912576.1 hypothetical protein B0H18DRAFT_242039 [Neoantrodia serialis]
MATDEPPTTSTTPATPTDAPFPFDSPHADVILQSCDGVNFRVRKAILAEASPVFDSMFTLPSGQSAEANDNNSQDLPIVPVTEDSTALTGLLHLCYPADRRLRRGLSMNFAPYWRRLGSMRWTGRNAISCRSCGVLSKITSASARVLHRHTLQNGRRPDPRRCKELP